LPGYARDPDGEGGRHLKRYDPIVNRPPVRLLGLLAFGALLAQAGHLIAYELEFGAAAQAAQSQGAHAYFPGLAKSSLGAIAAIALGSLLLLGVARLFPGRPVVVTSHGPSYMSLLAILFTIQVATFIAQETVESLAAGEAVPSVLLLILLGSAGQLPVALLAALALKWLAIRVEAAFVTLRTELSVEPFAAAPSSPVLPLPELVPVLALAGSCPVVYIKRGPPAILRA
jgi:hypothetical protein